MDMPKLARPGHFSFAGHARFVQEFCTGTHSCGAIYIWINVGISRSCSSEAVSQGCVVINGDRTLNVFPSMCRREFFTRFHVEVGTSWRCFFSVLTRGLLQTPHWHAQTTSHDVHLEQCRELHAWPHGGREPKLRSEQGFQDLEHIFLMLTQELLTRVHAQVGTPWFFVFSQFTSKGAFAFRVRVFSHQRPQSNLAHRRWLIRHRQSCKCRVEGRQ